MLLALDRDRECEVELLPPLVLLLDPDLDDEDRNQDKEGADKLLCRSLFFDFRLEILGSSGSGSSI
jgi:hypothetical protein